MFHLFQFQFQFVKLGQINFLFPHELAAGLLLAKKIVKASFHLYNEK